MGAARRRSGAESGFAGYVRPDGCFGARNHVLVLPVNGLAMRSAEKIGARIAGAVVAGSLAGRGHVEPDLTLQLAQLVGLARNPNVAATLVVGVDEATTRLVAGRIAATGKPTDAVSFAQHEEDALSVIDDGVRRAALLARDASRLRRVAAPLSALVVAAECGHSDWTSGLAGNPVAGAALDLLVDAGGTAIVGETVEWLGAEHLLARRAADPAVAAAITQAVAGREAFAAASGASLTGNNPGEENIRGGLSTIEEKSLGAVAKTGARAIRGLLAHGEAPAAAGLHLMDGPSFSPESMSGFAAAGAQVMLFTTGPGNSFASAIAPTIKITARAETARRLTTQIDFDASPVLRGAETIEAAGARLLEAIIATASGALTFGEILGEGLESLTRVRGAL